jgi:OHCU decarboxylase
VLLNIGLDQLNAFSRERAEAEFLKCCGSSRWAESMAAARPFTSPERLFENADSVWRSLGTGDWLEAFRAHPKIGEKKAAATQSEQAQAWSAQEQAGAENASTRTMADLAERNREYEQRFGFIFIVCATGKSSEVMLTILNARMHNDMDTELRIAAEEQRKITRLRLEKLLNR